MPADHDDRERRRFAGRVDRALAAEIARTESGLRLFELISTYGNEQYQFEQTPADRVEYILDLLDVSSDDILFDLGSGYGNFLLIGSVLRKGRFAGGRFVGVELVTARHRAAIKVRDRFGLADVDFVNGQVLDADLSVGNKFYMFSPFFPSTLAEVCARLEKVGNTKPLTIVATSHTALYVQNLKWLEKQPVAAPRGKRTVFDLGISLFKSRI